jgi:act minimal PKS chain-length factor (CLF/KS beta)
MKQLITGLGVATPLGLGAEPHWDALLRGANGIRRIERFDPGQYATTLAGEITDFADAEHIPGRLLSQTDRVTRLALAAADWALADAKVEPSGEAEFRIGVITSNASGGFEFTQREIQKLWRDGPSHVSAYQSFAWFYAVNTGQISIRNGFRGPSGVLIAGQAGGLDAIGHARRQLGDGIDMVVTGGVEAPLSPFGLVSHLSTGELSEASDAREAFLPFDPRANGYVLGEGGAILILETEESAWRRGIDHAYGEVAGYGASFDPRPGSSRPSAYRGAIRSALADAALEPSDVDVVFADGAGTAAGDLAESAAIAEVFGAYGVPVTVPKTTTGRLLAGGPGVDVADALLAIRDGVIPPTAHVEHVAPEHPIDLVLGEARETGPRTALVLARGRGGFNSALLVKAPS